MAKRSYQLGLLSAMVGIAAILRSVGARPSSANGPEEPARAKIDLKAIKAHESNFDVSCSTETSTVRLPRVG